MAKRKLAQEWMERGKKDLEDAEFLLMNNRALENVAFHIQQALEKYLKGFLIYKGWKLEKIHDLRKLLAEAIPIDKKFEEFIDPLKKITEYYADSRYPVGYPLEYTRKEIRDSLHQAKSLVAYIKDKVK